MRGSTEAAEQLGVKPCVSAEELRAADVEPVVVAGAGYVVTFTMLWQMRVDPEILYIKALIADGAQGSIYQIRRRHCLSWHAAQPRVRIVLACRSDLQTRYIPDDVDHAINLLYSGGGREFDRDRRRSGRTGAE